jgi:hypothetical protein
VCYSGSEKRVEARLPNYITTFAYSAAPFLDRLLERTSSLGVAGGSTVEALAGALPIRLNPRREPLRVVPISCASPPKSKPLATSIARMISTKLNGSDVGVPDLQSVPVATENHAETAKSHPNWAQVFDTNGFCREDLQMVLTSAGNFHRWEEWGPIRRRDLEDAGVIGDINLSLVPAKRADTSPRGAFTRYARLGTGLSLAAFQDLASRAVRTSRPGVVLAVLGENKREITARLIELAAINILVCDLELAIWLKRIFRIR